MPTKDTFSTRLNALVALGVLAHIATASAQTTAPIRGFAGAAIALASADPPREGRSNADSGNGIWLLEGALFVTKRAAIGAELVWLGTNVTAGGSPRFQIEEEHQERALFGTVRIRLVSHTRGAVDVVAGAGALFQRRLTRALSVPEASTEVAQTSPAYLARVELPFQIARHVALGPSAGVYVLRRPDATDSLLNLTRTQPSTRVTLSLLARVGW